MLEWFFSLNLMGYIYLSVGISSTIVVLVKAVLTAAKFYGIDKLNVEPEDLEHYDEIANNDSDIEKHVPRFLSIVSVNVFLMAFCWSYFIFTLFNSVLIANIFAFIFAICVLLLYGVIDYLWKRKAMKSNKT